MMHLVSNLNPQFEILKYFLWFPYIDDFMKSKQRKVISVHISISTVHEMLL